MIQRHQPLWACAALLLALVLATCYWQAPGRAMTHDELNGYMQAIERDAVLPGAMRGQFLRQLRAFGEADDGRPFYLVELARERGELATWPGAHVRAAHPRLALAIYEHAAARIALRQGTMPAMMGTMPGPALLDGAGVANWNRLGITRWPDRRALFAMVSHPDYLKALPYKLAALDVVLLPVDERLVLPDLRVLVGATALILLLAFGWWRCHRGAMSTQRRR